MHDRKLYENILKFYSSATKAQDHQLTKTVLQVVSIHESMLLCCLHSCHIWKSLFIIREKVAVPVQLAGKFDK